MLEKENRTILSLLNIKPSEKGFYEPDKSPAESPSVDDPPARRELRVLESPPDFSGKSGNRG